MPAGRWTLSTTSSPAAGVCAFSTSSMTLRGNAWPPKGCRSEPDRSVEHSSFEKFSQHLATNKKFVGSLLYWAWVANRF
jgi:hypothetical protein